MQFCCLFWCSSRGEQQQQQQQPNKPTPLARTSVRYAFPQSASGQQLRNLNCSSLHDREPRSTPVLTHAREESSGRMVKIPFRIPLQPLGQARSMVSLPEVACAISRRKQTVHFLFIAVASRFDLCIRKEVTLLWTFVIYFANLTKKAKECEDRVSLAAVWERSCPHELSDQLVPSPSSSS